jgi:hypothetical protein
MATTYLTALVWDCCSDSLKRAISECERVMAENMFSELVHPVILRDRGVSPKAIRGSWKSSATCENYRKYEIAGFRLLEYITDAKENFVTGLAGKAPLKGKLDRITGEEAEVIHPGYGYGEGILCIDSPNGEYRDFLYNQNLIEFRENIPEVIRLELSYLNSIVYTGIDLKVFYEVHKQIAIEASRKGRKHKEDWDSIIRSIDFSNTCNFEQLSRKILEHPLQTESRKDNLIRSMKKWIWDNRYKLYHHLMVGKGVPSSEYILKLSKPPFDYDDKNRRAQERT